MKDKEDSPNSKKSFWENGAVKNSILLGIPVILSVISIIVSIWKKHVSFFLIVTLILLMVFLISAFGYGRSEKRGRNEQEQKIKNLEDQVTSLSNIKAKSDMQSKIIAAYQELTEEYSGSINKIAKSIEERGIVEVNNWSIEVLGTEICKACSRMLIEYTGFSERDISVGFIETYVENGKQYVNMLSCSDPGSSRPFIYHKKQPIEECIYYYKNIIIAENPDVVAIANKDVIQQIFIKRREGSDLSKYSQYIAIPIICGDNKIIGILQVDVKHDKQIRKTDEELQDFSRAYIMPYGNLLLLINKIRKGLLAQPKKAEEL